MDRLRRTARILVGSPWPLTLLVLAPLALAVAARQGTLWSQGVLDTQPWFHPIPPRGAWIPFIHPPAYSEFMHWVSALSDRLWIGEGYLIYLSSGLVSAALMVVFARTLGRRAGAAWALYGSLLLLLSPATLRPFEHYPLTKLTVTVSVLLALHWIRDARRAALVGAALLSLLSVMLHLSAWFVIGPALAAATVLAGDRRRPAALLTVGLVATFLLLGFVGTTTLWDILESTGPAQNRSAEGVVSWSNLTYEWNNPWLWAPVLLWALPGVAFERRDGAALAFGMGSFAILTFVLMWQALVIAGGWVGSHHYFELIDGLACYAAALACAAAWRSTTSKMGRAALVLGMTLLLAEHVRLYLRGLAKLEELAWFPG